MRSTIHPNQYVALCLPSAQVKVEQVVPNTTISLGKHGSFQTNQILGRPFNVTFEILDRAETHDGVALRIVPPAELHASDLIQQAESPADLEHQLPVDARNLGVGGVSTVQSLAKADSEGPGTIEGRPATYIIAKILDDHLPREQRTMFSMAKYNLRKNQKCLKRFSVHPIDVPTLTDWLMNERDFGKVLEIRNEMLALVGCWANIHHTGVLHLDARPSGNYLVVDDTGGLLVAAMAERMGVLHPKWQDESVAVSMNDRGSVADASIGSVHTTAIPAMSARSNTITLLHSNSQPSLAMLRYFDFDANNPSPHHPLHAHLKTLSWLQLLSPASDPTTTKPASVSSEALVKMKSSKRSSYYRKHRRWSRIQSVIDSTRRGGYDGLVLATVTCPISILRHTLPLLADGAQVAIYSPHVEPLVELADLYSTARRTDFINAAEEDRVKMSQQFPLDPTLLLAPSVQTTRLKRWQFLLERTHPFMMSRGGAEGYVFVATKTLPAQGKIEARGRMGGKRRKTRRDVAVEV